MKDRPLIEVAPHRDTICLPPDTTVAGGLRAHARSPGLAPWW